MKINIEEILKKDLIGKEVDTYYRNIENNKVIDYIYRKSIIKDVSCNSDTPEDIGLTISCLLENGKTIILEPQYCDKDGYYEY